MRVSLQIDGDAKGGEQAIDEAKRAVVDLASTTESASTKMKDALEKAGSSVDKIKDANKGGSEANDNFVSSLGGVAQKISEFASKTVGAESALTKAASGAGSLAGRIADVVKSAGSFSMVGAAISLASTAVSTFYDLANSGAAAAERRLEEQARLIGVVRDAYKDATKSAGEFFAQSKAVTELQLRQNLIGLKSDRDKAATGLVKGFEWNALNTQMGALNEPFANPADMENIKALQVAVDGLKASIAAGIPDIKQYQEEIANIGLRAKDSNPALAAAANKILEQSKSANELANRIEETEAALAQLNGTATEHQKKVLGIKTETAETANEFDRLTKAMQRQAAAQEAEALTTGKSAGEAAKLRAQYLLNEAAQQSGIKVAGEYAQRIQAIADRFGAAAQKAAELRLRSDAAFNLSQLGRTQIDATVADQLRGVFGDKADQNGALANAIRFNEQMRELKSNTLEVASGAFRDFRASLDQGATAWQAFGNAAVNAINRIIEKLADKALDSMISKLFGAFMPSFGGLFGGGSGGGTGLSLTGTGGLYDEGGYTGPGGKYEPAGIVHKGEYVFDQDAVNSIGLGNLTRLHRGYADGGLVGGAPSFPARLAAANEGGDPSNRLGALGVHVDVGVSVDDDGKMQAYVKRISTQASNEAVAGFAQSKAFVSSVAAANTTAAKRRLQG